MKRLSKGAVLFAALALSAQTVTLANASADAVCFVLREYDGKIALLEEGSDEPLAIYKTPIDSLFPADAELLRDGIRLKNRAEVARLVEDLDLE